MPRVPNKFIDPIDNRTYSWEVNHLSESGMGRRRNIEHTAPTSGTGLIRQQGADEPLVFELSGTILHDTQHAEMIAWFETSRDRTIYFEDFAGHRYEVLLTSFLPKREWLLRNPRTGTSYKYTYDLTMEVVRAITGPWVGSTP